MTVKFYMNLRFQKNIIFIMNFPIKLKYAFETGKHILLASIIKVENNTEFKTY